ncbi:hypothetical protein B0H14DRAFT_2579897 [Mycena olivaceomarginata]|nr:hypothetical protein B0H14DRAFT_2579897 [Mycena olivaceomarginata]
MTDVVAQTLRMGGQFGILDWNRVSDSLIVIVKLNFERSSMFSGKQPRRAAQTLRKYTETLDDGFARKLEQLLASFGRQTQLEETNALVTVPITQWFTRTA